VIPPRRADATDDADLVPGVLGLVALAGEVRALVTALAAAPDEDVAVDADVVDFVLGLAALADEVARRVPAEPDVVVHTESRETVVIEGLLR
jgi:hypothetical protein